MKRNFLAINRYKELPNKSIKVVEKDNVGGLVAGSHLIMINEDIEEATYIIKLENIVYKEDINLVFFSYIEKLSFQLSKSYWMMFKESENEKRFK